MFISMGVNLAMHIDIMMMGNRDTAWLYVLYSYSENIINIFLFVSVLVARRWSEVFSWLKSAHSRKTNSNNPPDLPAQSAEEALSELAYHYQISGNKTVSHFLNIKAIWRYIHFIYSTTEEEKLAFRYQSNLNAERLLARYMHLKARPTPEERMTLMDEWKGDLTRYFNNKPSGYRVKDKIIEVDFQK
jgi:hypothetical protein